MKTREDFPTILKYKFYVLNENFPEYFAIKAPSAREFTNPVEKQYHM